LAGIPLYKDLDAKIGNVKELLNSEFAEKVREIAEKL